TFKPLQDVTRADFAVVITRTFEGWKALSTVDVSGMQSAGAQQRTQSFTYPNPFSESTTISYAVEQDGFVTVEVFDILGKKVNTIVSESKAAGSHTVQFNGSNLPSGTYLYRINTGGKTYTNRMMITK
ncbi:T9SS type A sorting domain-containing protein, partial [Pontibacter pamirensis]|uniref:T9SS type A sorting domain-containing protein n=1 Tax=Pontibacter pamirensis TaxID=2562824 RepID=UPI00138A2F8B